MSVLVLVFPEQPDATQVAERASQEKNRNDAE
jgi:hypothetical protein